METDGERIYRYLSGDEKAAKKDGTTVPLVQGRQRWESEKYKLKDLLQALANTEGKR